MSLSSKESLTNVTGGQIEAEFADIRSIYTNRTPSGGFKNVHVRKRVLAPLSNTKISLTELERSFPPRRKYKALGINRSLGAIHHSFAWDIDDGVTLWGTTDERNQVHVICLALGVRGQHANTDWIIALGRFCADRNPASRGAIPRRGPASRSATPWQGPKTAGRKQRRLLPNKLVIILCCLVRLDRAYQTR